MTDIEYKNAVDGVIDLCRHAVNGTVPDRERISRLDLDRLYAISEGHMISSMTGQVLRSAGITAPSFENAVAAAQRKEILLSHDLDGVTAALEKAGIWHMPLKGIVIKDDYPRFAMREMCDCDVLFDDSRADDVKSIMEKLGFATKEFGIGAADVYYKQPVSNFEMHRELFGAYQDKRLYEYYADVKERLIRDGESRYRYRFSPEDAYVFLVAHEYKHYSHSGTGLRSLLDVYVFLKNHRIDRDYVEGETEKLGIKEFEEKNRSLALALFGGGELTAADRRMLAYILSSGTYGTIEHKVQNKLRDSAGGKRSYLMRRIFGPGKTDPEREHFEKTYPLFFRRKVLLPALPLYRFFRAVKRSPERIGEEIKALGRAKRESRRESEEER
jgi:hypothetical protein